MCLHSFYIAFKSVALVTKKLWAIQDLFLHRPDFLLPCTLYYAFKKMFLQKIISISIH